MTLQELTGVRSQSTWSPINEMRLEVLVKAALPYKKHQFLSLLFSTVLTYIFTESTWEKPSALSAKGGKQSKTNMKRKVQQKSLSGKGTSNSKASKISFRVRNCYYLYECPLDALWLETTCIHAFLVKCFYCALVFKQ